MSKFIELNSTYRDRNLWPIPGEFEIPVSQTGIINNKNEAIDPVALSEPLVAWTSNNLGNLANSVSISGGIIPSGAADSYSFFINTANIFRNINDYYLRLVFKFTTDLGQVGYSKIISYTYYGTKGLIILDNPIFNYNDIVNTPYVIYDPSDFSIPDYPILFVPNGRRQENAYSNYIVYNETINDWSNITYYDSIHNLISFESVSGWNTNDNYNIRKQPPLIPLKKEISTQINNTSTLNIIIIIISTANSKFSDIQDFYKNYFLRLRPVIYNNNFISESRRIITYIYDEKNNKITFNVYPSFSSKIDLTTVYTIEILPFSYDNFSPFNYTGTLLQQSCCYEFELVNLILPNQILSVGEGNKIAFYPYVYVELTNITSSNSGYNNAIFSNNPNATKMVFRIPVYDVQDPESTPFVRLIDASMTQVLKFKPNDNLLFSVRLSNGEIYNTIVPEFYSPSIPNPQVQISAIFAIRRVI